MFGTVNGMLAASVLLLSNSQAVFFDQTAKDRSPTAVSVEQKYRFDLLDTKPQKGVGDRGSRVIFSQDGKLFGARSDTAIVIWDTASGREKTRIQTDQVASHIEFSPEGDYIIGVYPSNTGAPAGRIRRFAISSGREDASLEYEGHFRGFLPNSKQFLVLDDGVIELRDSKTGALSNAFRVHRSQIGIGVSFFSASAKLMAFKYVSEKNYKIWQIESGEASTIFSGPDARSRSACFSPTGERIAYTGADKTVGVLDLRTGKRAFHVLLPLVGINVAFSPDDKWIAVRATGNKSQVFILDATSGKELLSWDTEPSGSVDLAVNSDGKLLATSSTRVLQVWEITIKNLDK